MFLLGGSFIFKLLYPHELCTNGLSGPPFGSHVLGAGRVQQPALHDGVEEDDQTKKIPPHVLG